MATKPTVSDLRKAAEVADQEIDAAVDAVLADLAVEAYPLAKGWTLDLVGAVAGHKAAKDALLTDKPAYKRNMVRTAILLAYPVKAWGESDTQAHDTASHHIRLDLVRRHRGRKHGYVRYGDKVGHGLESGPTGRPP